MTTLSRFAVLTALLCTPPVIATASRQHRAAGVSFTKPATREVELSAAAPFAFEPNKGQFESGVAFGARGPNHALLLNAQGLSLKLRDPSAGSVFVVEMTLQNSNPNAVLSGEQPLPGEVNYFRGNPDEWITRVPAYERVIAHGVYAGIDAVYYGNNDGFEYDFVVHPGASPKTINLVAANASNIAVTGDGELEISIAGRKIRQSRPIVYQEVNGRRVLVDGRYVAGPGNHIGFAVGTYDTSRPLIIDPQLLYAKWFFMGRAYGVAVDPFGNVYVAGVTLDISDRDTDVWVEKWSPSGTRLWSNRIGAAFKSDWVAGVAVDPAGNAWIAGWTEQRPTPPTSFPLVNPIQPAEGGAGDAYVARFDPSGQLTYSTLLGGSGGDAANGIAVDSLGNVVVVGTTSSPNFPVSKPFQNALRGGADAFVTILNPQGSAFIYSTYIGGSGADQATAVAVDGSGNAYVAGITDSADFPIANPIRGVFSGGLDAFALKLNAAGSALMYGTYLGGRGDDGARGIAVDASGSAYVFGTTNSTDFPTAAAYQPDSAGGIDAFVTKINPAGSAFSYSTYLGGANDEQPDSYLFCEEKRTCGGIAVNAAGNAFVTGTTASANFPQVRSFQPFDAAVEAYIAEFSPDGASLVYSTLLGGSVSDVERAPNTARNAGAAIALDSSGDVYVAGTTNAMDFPMAPESDSAPATANASWNGINGFLARINDVVPPQSSWTRVEQNHSSVAYNGVWYVDSHGFNSGGSAVNSMDAGSRATFTFNGTAAKWIGFKDPWSGIARIYVDGAFRTEVDAYSAVDQARVVMYTISGLPAGSHTLTVEVAGTRNPSASGRWIWVDAFEFTSGTTPPGETGGSTGGGSGPPGRSGGVYTRVEQTNAAVSFSGVWYNAGHATNSGGSAANAMERGSRAVFTFNGTAVRWIGVKEAWSGIAKVYIDGVLQGEVDGYSASDQMQAVLYETSGLPAGAHTITIEVAGARNPSARGLWVWVDAFE